MAMSFEEKFNLCISNLSNIGKPDYAKTDINLFADFVELLVIFSKGDGISYGDINDRLFGEPDDFTTERIDGYTTNGYTAERNDNNESFIGEILALISERAAQYGDLYPFNVDINHNISLKNDLTAPHKIYLFLLLSSSLNIFKSFNTEITSDFEVVSYETLKLFLPNSIVKPFGKKSVYDGTAKEKIIKLAADIGLPVDEYEINCVGERNVQERGLDIVSWLPSKDKCQNKVVFLCQCACGKQYESKQHDTRRYENYYIFYKTLPQHTLFIPYSLINPKEGKFYHSDFIEKDYLVFERLRIISITKHNTDVLDLLESTRLVERCIQEYRTNIK